VTNHDQSKEDATVVYTDPLEALEQILREGLPDNADLTSLFSTNEGKQFAENVENQKQFTLTGTTFQMVIELFFRVVPRLASVFSNGGFKDWWNQQIGSDPDIDEKGKKALMQFPEMMELALSQDDTKEAEAPLDFIELFGERTRERFIGAMVFSLHSYAQAYIDSVIESLVRDDSTRAEFLESCDSRRILQRLSLSELNEAAVDKYGVIAELVRRSLPSGLLKRMKAVCQALGYQKELDKVIRSRSLDKVDDDFQYFCDWRNRIAHGDPAPDLKQYVSEVTPTAWDDLTKSIREWFHGFWPIPPEEVEALIELGFEWAKSTSVLDFFLALDGLTKMVLLFPALFDFVVSMAKQKTLPTAPDGAEPTE